MPGGKKGTAVSDLRVIPEFGDLYHGTSDGRYEVYGGAELRHVVRQAIALSRLIPSQRVTFKFFSMLTNQVTITVEPDSDLELIMRVCEVARARGITQIGPHPDKPSAV